MGFSRNNKVSWLAAACLATGVALAPADSAHAEEAAPDYVSGTVGIDWNSHFVSYGFDVWGTGNNFGDNDVINPYAEVAFEIGDFSLFTGFWADINDNAADSIGGDIQEIDYWVGGGYGYESWSFSVLYQSWNYAGGIEHILDVNIGYDDTGLIIDDFAFNPSLTIHNRIGSDNLGLDNGTILVFGVGPGFTIYEDEGTTIDMSIPVSVGISLEDSYFTAGGESGYAYTSVGAAFSMPMTFIAEGYGDWSLGAALTMFFTQGSVYNNNDDNFITGTLGVSLAF